MSIIILTCQNSFIIRSPDYRITSPFSTFIIYYYFIIHLPSLVSSIKHVACVNKNCVISHFLDTFIIYKYLYSTDFGIGYVETITEHFAAVLENQGVAIDQIKTEWFRIKSAMYLGKEIVWRKRLSETSWPQLNRRFGETCPNFLHMIDLIYTLPASTAECERGFSVMKTTKTDWRSSLSSERLSDLIMICLHSPPISEFNPSTAIDLWRRVSETKWRYTSYIRPKSSETIVLDQENAEENKEEDQEQDDSTDYSSAESLSDSDTDL